MKFPKREDNGGDGKGSKLFVKLGDGASTAGVFRGELYEFYSKWVSNKSVLTTADDPDGKARFRLNFVTTEDGKLVSKIFEFGMPVYEQLQNLSEDFVVDQTKVKILRKGLKLETVYFITPLGKIASKDMKAIEAVDLQVIEHKPSQQSAPPPFAPSGEFSSDDNHDEIPF
jgi:hypothetical protein